MGSTVLFSLLLLSSCADEKEIPVLAEKGIIDLSDKITEPEEVIILKGEWQFFWDKWILPKNIESLVEQKEVQYVSVPAAWNTYKDPKTGKNYSSQGAATYRIQVKLPKNLHKGELFRFLKYGQLIKYLLIKN
jgi:hypothetical protein